MSFDQLPLRKTFCINWVAQGCEDGSVGKAFSVQAWQPEFKAPEPT